MANLGNAKKLITETIPGKLKKPITEATNRIVMLPCENLIIDPKQPFRLYTEEQLADLAMRIKQSGLLNPITVRPTKLNKDRYEILSGRNRTRAVMLNGDKEIAAIIREVDNDEATMIMLDANLGQRKDLLPSEKAKAYKMEAEILGRKGMRIQPNLGTKCPIRESYDARQKIADKYGESKRNISNYIRLDYLSKELLSYIDEKKLTILTGVELSYLKANEQDFIFSKYISKGKKLSPSQLSALKILSKENNFLPHEVQNILGENKPVNAHKKEFIKFDKSKFTQFIDTIGESKLEQLFLEFLESYQNKGR
jgi:ParB family chromosome partitioning protein